MLIIIFNHNLRGTLRTKNQFLKNQKENYQIAPNSNKTIGQVLLMVIFVEQKAVNLISLKKHQIDTKVLRQDKNFSTRLPYANENFKKNIFHWLILNIIQHKT